MKKVTVITICWILSLAAAETASAGWTFSKSGPVAKLKSACSDYYDAATEKEKRMQLKRASEALAALSANAWISEKRILSTLKKYRKSEPKSVAVVILALDTYPSDALAVFYETIVTPDAIQWANDIAKSKTETLMLSSK